MPASVVPVTTHVDSIVGNNDEVKRPCRDRVVAARADILLDCLIRLHWYDRHPEKMAHAITANVTSTAITTMAMSNAVF